MTGLTLAFFPSSTDNLIIIEVLTELLENFPTLYKEIIYEW